jgi:hypothetical protein
MRVLAIVVLAAICGCERRADDVPPPSAAPEVEDPIALPPKVNKALVNNFLKLRKEV